MLGLTIDPVATAMLLTTRGRETVFLSLLLAGVPVFVDTADIDVKGQPSSYQVSRAVNVTSKLSFVKTAGHFADTAGQQ